MENTRQDLNPSSRNADRIRETWRRRLAGLPPAMQLEILVDAVASRAAAVTGRPELVERTAPWRMLGVYREKAGRLRDEVATDTGVELPATVFFDRPTPMALAAFVRARLLGLAEEAPAEPGQSANLDDDRIAVVGMGCRLPGGADSPQALWNLVAAEADVIGELPTDRGWDLDGLYHPDPDHPGTAYTRHGGFLTGIDLFDAAFFGISPREAKALDPQQRLMLEISWEALERAGIDPHDLRGSRTGVYTGVSLQDYGPAWDLAPHDIQGQLLTGNALGVVSGRIAYAFGLEGPALTIDTQCSASLVALHLAAQALRAGECDLALAGGVTVMSTPAMLLEFSRKRGLAPDGRCKAFSADADGTGWAEGAGIVLLERLSDARRQGHQVLAVLAGSAVNQDGATNGLAAPNGQSQQRLIRQALANARLTPADVDLVEAHGTGTALGDPIEAHAIVTSYGHDRPTHRPLHLGSLKSNIGHAQAAAGVAGVIKVVQAMRHATLPRTLHIARPSPHVDWATANVSLLTEARPWHRHDDQPRRAGVSAFGVSGTNAHVILEEAPAPADDPAGEERKATGSRGTRARGEATRRRTPTPSIPEQPDRGRQAPVSAASLAAGVAVSSGRPRPTTTSADSDSDADADVAPPVPVVLSARDDTALRAYAARLADHLTHHPDTHPADLAHTLNHRTRFPARAIALTHPYDPDNTRLIATLTDLAHNHPTPALIRNAPTPHPRVTLLFTGQGSQHNGMGRRLHATHPAFAHALDTVCAHFEPHLDTPLRDVMFAPPGTSHAALLHQTAYTQPALFAYQTALHHLIQSLGITPHLLVGHSIGELTAAHIAGILTLPDAAALVAARGRLMQTCTPGGTMTAIQATPEEVARTLLGHENTVSIAAVNGPASTVIAGGPDTVSRITRHWRQQGRATRQLTVSHAFHSPHMNPVLDQFRAVAESLTYHPSTIPIATTLTNPPPHTTPEYWVRHLRETVHFHDAIRTAHRRNTTAYLEIGPDATLTTLTAACLPPTDTTVHTIPTARRGHPETTTLLTALADLHTTGTDITWKNLRQKTAGRGRKLLDLPTYPFQRRRHWLDRTPRHHGGDQTTAAVGPEGWRYRVEWEPLDTAASPTRLDADLSSPALSGLWPVMIPSAGVPDTDIARICWIIERLGGTALRIPLDAGDADRTRIATRLVAFGATGTPPVGGLLSLLAVDDTPHPRHPGLTTGLALTVVLAQALHDLGVDAPLWCLTRGAVSINPHDALTHPTQAMIWGLGRTLALEHPAAWGGLIDTPTHLDDETLAWLGAALTNPTHEDQLAARPTGLHVPRLTRADPAGSATAPWDPRGDTVLITGGTGALGAHIARHLARQGAHHLILTSRRGSTAPGATELAAELTALGARTTFRSCDTADPDQLGALLADLGQDSDTRVTAVVHAAGIAGPTAPLRTLTLAQVEEVIATKATAAAHLHALTTGPAGRPAPVGETTGHPVRSKDDEPALNAFVLLSSISATWGSGSQAPYSAANAYLDALATHRHTHHQPAISLAYGPWAQAGIGAEPALRAYLERRGLTPLVPDEAVRALTTTADPNTTVVDITWNQFLPTYTAARPTHFFDRLRPDTDPGTSSAADATAGAAAVAGHPGLRPPDLAALPEAERHRTLRDLVRAEAAAILGHTHAYDLDPDRRFLELGFDSLASVQLSRRLTTTTGIPLTTPAVFEHPTITELAHHLASNITSRPTGHGTGRPDGTDALATSSALPTSRTVPTSSATPADPVGVRGLYRQACAMGKFTEGVGVLRAAARLRPTFTAQSELTTAFRPVRLASGPATPTLICLPSMVAPSGPHNFARLALHLHTHRDVYALPHPGFGDDELLPATPDLVIDIHTDTLTRAFPHTPIALAGYSSGGWLAHAIAARLEAHGHPPTAVLLLDTWFPGDQIPEKHIQEELRGIAVNDQAYALMTEAQVTAQGAYLDLFEGWKPTSVRAPVVLIKAMERMSQLVSDGQSTGEAGGWTNDWDVQHDTVKAAGNHQTMMNEYASSTARTIHTWLNELVTPEASTHEGTLEDIRAGVR